MNKKILIILAILLLFTGFAFAELELGVGITPPLEDVEGATGDFGQDMLISFHGGYSFWWLFYASWDAYVMPAYLMSALTETIDDSGNVSPGVYKPGFLNMFDVGIRPRIGPLMVMAEVGINTLYVYEQSEDEQSELGGNIRVGAGLHFNHISIMGTVSSVFSSFDSMTNTLEDLGSGDAWLEEKAQEKIMETLIPTITVNLWF
ncbi:MAG: hypothetical protein JEY99_18140 [Spirochaetales bacterium]|nr:hypothetical protein [Spirochaetales bacterium]